MFRFLGGKLRFYTFLDFWFGVNGVKSMVKGGNMNIDISIIPIWRLKVWNKMVNHKRYDYYISRVNNTVRLHKIDKIGVKNESNNL